MTHFALQKTAMPDYETHLHNFAPSYTVVCTCASEFIKALLTYQGLSWLDQQNYDDKILQPETIAIS